MGEGEGSDESKQQSVAVLFVVALLMAAISFWIFNRKNTTTTKTTTATPSSKKKQKAAHSGSKNTASEGKERSAEEKTKIVTIKEHSREVHSVDVSPDGNYLITASEDRTLRLWSIASLLQKTPSHIRISTELDHATYCKFAPTIPKATTENKGAVSTASPKGLYLVAVAMASSRSIHLFGIKDKKSKEGKSQWKLIRQFRVEHKSSITSIDFTSDTKYILSVSEQTEAKLWNLQGVLIATVNTNQFKNFMGCFAPHSLSFSIATFTGDARVWEIENDKQGNFQKVNKTMQLASDAHKTSVHCVSFSSDSKTVVTASKDGTWKCWSIARSSQHDRGFVDDPQCLLTVKVDPTTPLPLNLISLSPSLSKQMVAVTSNASLFFYSIDGTLIRSIPSAHKDTITSIVWLKDSQHLATSSLDKQVILWNPTS